MTISTLLLDLDDVTLPKEPVARKRGRAPNPEGTPVELQRVLAPKCLGPGYVVSLMDRSDEEFNSVTARCFYLTLARGQGSAASPLRLDDPMIVDAIQLRLSEENLDEPGLDADTEYAVLAAARRVQRFVSNGAKVASADSIDAMVYCILGSAYHNKEARYGSEVSRDDLRKISKDGEASVQPVLSLQTEAERGSRTQPMIEAAQNMVRVRRWFGAALLQNWMRDSGVTTPEDWAHVYGATARRVGLSRESIVNFHASIPEVRRPASFGPLADAIWGPEEYVVTQLDSASE